MIVTSPPARRAGTPWRLRGEVKGGRGAGGMRGRAVKLERVGRTVRSNKSSRVLLGRARDP